MSQGRQVALLTGEGASMQDDGTILLQTAQVEYAGAGGDTNANIIVLATNCVADLKRNVVRSADGLSLRTADGQFSLAGVGFVWAQTNNELIVSHRVRTLVRKHPTSGADAIPLSIQSERFGLNYASNIVTFLDGVRAEDPEMTVDCGRLTVRRSATGKFDHMLAEDKVRITSLRDGSVTSSERAEYTLSEAGELMDLTGDPHWQSDLREARAGRFLFRRTPKAEPQFLKAIGDAWIKLPAGTNEFAAWPLMLTPAQAPGSGVQAPTAGAPAEPGTPSTQTPPRFLELASGLITIALPPTNGPAQGIVAETNVVLRATADGWQATAQLATLTNALLELSGLPVWTQGDRSVRGDVLLLDTRDRSFAARGGAHIRFPASDFGVVLPGLGGTNASAFVIRTNLDVIVESELAEFRSGVLRFAPPVKAQLVESNVTLGRLTCRDLTVTYRDRLEGLAADGEVRLEQFARPGRRSLERELECASFRLEFDSAGRVRALRAEGGVKGWQSELRPTMTEPLLTRVQAQRVTAGFLTHTNQLESAVAEGQVRLEREQRLAEGQRAEFTGSSGLLTLTGQPVVSSADGRITDATKLIWDSRTGTVRGEGPFRIEWLRVPTNVTALRLGPPRKD